MLKGAISNLTQQVHTQKFSWALTSSTRTAGAIPPALLKAQGKLSSPAPRADFSIIKTAPAEDRLGAPDSRAGLASKLMLSLANSSMAEREEETGRQQLGVLNGAEPPRSLQGAGAAAALQPSLLCSRVKFKGLLSLPRHHPRRRAIKRAGRVWGCPKPPPLTCPQPSAHLIRGKSKHRVPGPEKTQSNPTQLHPKPTCSGQPFVGLFFSPSSC